MKTRQFRTLIVLMLIQIFISLSMLFDIREDVNFTSQNVVELWRSIYSIQEDISWQNEMISHIAKQY